MFVSSIVPYLREPDRSVFQVFDYDAGQHSGEKRRAAQVEGPVQMIELVRASGILQKPVRESSEDD